MTTPEPVSRTNTMDSQTSQPSPEKIYGRGDNGSTTGLSSYGSQTSLIGTRSEYESASEAEAETTTTDLGSGSHTPSQPTAPGTLPSQAYPPGTNPANLSGLVCNVHRTTGKEPHPLVGATTTVLGDKLYVFGGRRLSRTKPQLTSNLYELDLIRRHWTKLSPQGDVPSPRYFHSMCALGDTKLVCYGGMSPAPVSESNSESPPEVAVMSDVHIYDVLTHTWTKINTPDPPQGRYAHCAAILPSSAVFASPNAPMSAVHHNPAGENPNQGSLGVAIDGTGGAEMVVVGGQDSANHYIEQVSVFNLRSLKWTGTTGMGRSCGAYRSVVTPLTGMTTSQIGAGPHARNELEEDDEEPGAWIGSGAPMLIYSNYNFLDVKLELQVRLTDGTLTEKPMQTAVSPPGLRFPNGGVIDNHFVVSGTFLTSSKQEYALWALDLRTLTWSRIDAGGSIFSQGSWNRGVLWSRRNSFVVLGNRKRSLVDDYNNRRINFSNICVVELEAFGLYDNPKIAEPTSNFISASALIQPPSSDISLSRLLSSAAEDIGALALNTRELADMDFLAIDGTRVPVNSRLISRRWGPHFISLLRESLATSETDTATLRPNVANHPSRNSSITITPSITSSNATTLTANSTVTSTDLLDTRSAPPTTRPRLLYLPHTAPTLHALLHYLYTLTLPASPHPLATPQIFCSLLQLARPYKISGLLEAVVERLHSSLDGRNAAAIFNAAAMGAGGGDSVHFATSRATIRESDIPIRTASLGGMDGLMTNGVGGSDPRAGRDGLRVKTEMANGRSARTTPRPGQTGLASDTEDDDTEEPTSAVSGSSAGEGGDGLPTDDLSSSSSFSRGLDTDAAARMAVWSGACSSVVGLQKRGLRGLMEGRRMRERGFEGREGLAKVGLGIA
ncbi:regulatory protein ral2 [Zymoseptoria brevis]|uniref:Regulatory protein ral2 n=1 Tax=Zymoseptoria brevis TaxID=1047168 RepID=A0A0F4GUM4_9PEZI|nr:regulatory protein ral2 [Zymoseptoria brevis]